MERTLGGLCARCTHHCGHFLGHHAADDPLLIFILPFHVLCRDEEHLGEDLDVAIVVVIAVVDVVIDVVRVVWSAADDGDVLVGQEVRPRRQEEVAFRLVEGKTRKKMLEKRMELKDLRTPQDSNSIITACFYVDADIL